MWQRLNWTAATFPEGTGCTRHAVGSRRSDGDEMQHAESQQKGLTEVVVLKKRQLGEDVGSVRRLVWLGETVRRPGLAERQVGVRLISAVRYTSTWGCG